jgi:hypothetical protein
VLSSQRLDGRLTELTLSTAALRNRVHVRVILAEGLELAGLEPGWLAS